MEELQPFWGHVEDLRKLLLRCLFTILVFAFFSFLFSDKAIHLLAKTLPKSSLEVHSIEFEKITNRSSSAIEMPLPMHSELRFSSKDVLLSNGHYLLPPNAFIEVSKPKNLTLLSPAEGFTTTLKVAFWLGILLSGPIWIALIMKFIEPALKPLEKRQMLPIVFISASFILMGILLAIAFTMPLINSYFFAFNQTLGTNSWSLANFIDYALTIILGHGIAFASASILILAVYFHWIDAAILSSYRRHAIIIILIVSALLTPPDVLSQVLLAFPLLLLYEGAILYSSISKVRITEESYASR